LVLLSCPTRRSSDLLGGPCGAAGRAGLCAGPLRPAPGPRLSRPALYLPGRLAAASAAPALSAPPAPAASAASAGRLRRPASRRRSEEHTSELQSRFE